MCGVPEYFVIVHVLFAALQGLSISMADKLKQGDTKTLPTKAPCVYICMSLLDLQYRRQSKWESVYVCAHSHVHHPLAQNASSHARVHVYTVNLSLNPN